MPTLATTQPIEFSRRRERLQALMSQHGVTSAAVCSGWARPRNFAHNLYPFRAESHFLYLTGLQREGCVLLITGETQRLFVTEMPSEDALWHGPSPSCSELAAQLSLEVLPLERLSAPAETAALPPQDDESALWFGDLLGREIEAQDGPELSGSDLLLARAMVELRLQHDSAAEQQLRGAIGGSAQAHLAGLRRTRGARLETEVRGAMVGRLIEEGLVPSYQPIVTTHGEVLHSNSSPYPLETGGLLLADVGGETPEGWAGDITRTWPCSGQFSDSQRAIYELVLSVQEESIRAVKPGVRYRDLHVSALSRTTEGLRELGILKGSLHALMECGAGALFFPHGLGHLLGLDVHDMEDLGDLPGYPESRERSEHPSERALRLDRDLSPGMLVTIEPGFYQIPQLLQQARQSKTLSECVDFQRLLDFGDVRGIRIEDDVLVTQDGCEVLSSDAPKLVEDIEAAMR